jgi:acyl-CoA synthetase (AMP-forming)/AMP-acid ligase II
MARNFADLYEHAAAVFGDRIALVGGGRQVTYRELEERANRFAHYLSGIVRAGNHVRLYAHNSIEAAETIIAACSRRA